MLNIFIIGIIFICIFSIISITTFGGLFSRCDFSSVPEEFMDLIHNKWDCLDYGGTWINPYPNFDNIKSSFILLFEMMTTENWTFYMFSAIDAYKKDFQPIKDYRYNFVLFFSIYMIIAYFFLLNISFVIIAENFHKEKEEIKNLRFKLPIQNEFYKIYSKIYKIELPAKKIKINKITKILLNILETIYFDVFITCCIIANMAILMMNWPGMDEKTIGFINFMNSIFNFVFIFEAIFKIYVYKFSYFLNGWNLIDFVIVFNNFLNFFLKTFANFISKFFDPSTLRVIRVARILRLLKKAKTLNKIFNLFINTIQPIINVGVLYFILVFIYAIIGMNIFSHLKHQDIISKNWNFENFSNSAVMLIRVTTGESWNFIMHECLKERDINFFCKYSNELNDDDLISKILLIIFLFFNFF